MAEEVGDGHAAGEVGQGDPKPVAQHGDGGNFTGEPGYWQGHHVAGQQFAAGQNGQDQTDREDRGAQQRAERAPFGRQGADDVNIQQEAGGDKGAGEKAQNQQISERGAAFVYPGLNGEGGDFFW